MAIVMIVSWSAAGFFLVLLTPLILVFGGLLLGIPLLAGVLLLVPVLMVISALEGKPRYVTSEAAPAAEAAAPEPAVATMPAPAPVVATAVGIEGQCPMGLAFVEGDTWTLNGRWSGDMLCPRAEKPLSRVAGKLRSGEVRDGELWQCVGKAHKIVFELRMADASAAISDA